MKKLLFGSGRTFKGGIHPPEFKETTEMNIIEFYNDPQRDLVFPMSQHIGAPCTPIVKKGDRVLRGQKIGEAGGFVSSPVFSSVSGKVKDVKPMLTTSGAKVMSVIVENDHLYEEDPGMHKTYDYEKMTNQEICNVIKEAGIVGLGGACFPTHVKLSPQDPIDSIIVNGAECEPFLSSDYRLMIEEPQKVIGGLKIILKMFPDAKGYIAIENNKPNALAVMREMTAHDPRIEVVELRTKYPQGGEKQLINAVTGREVPSGGLPAKVGCIVINADTTAAINRAIHEGRPLLRRIVTLAGDAMNKTRTFKVRLGTNLEELVEAAGGLKTTPSKIIAGGPMMGMSMASLDVPVQKGTGGVLFLTEKIDFVGEESACIRCGKCIGACPIHLMPMMLNQVALNREWDEFVKMHGMDCMECGSCAYICPAKRHLTQSFKAAKKAVGDERRKAAAAAKAAEEKAQKEEKKNG